MFAFEIASVAAEQVFGVRPWVLALLSACGGAVVTFIGGLVGALLNGRREHTKWLREERLDVYVNVAAHLSELSILEQKDADATKLIREAKQLRETEHGADTTLAAQKYELAVKLQEEVLERMADTERRGHALFNRLRLLGPKSVDDAVMSVVPSLEAWNPRSFNSGMATLLQEMRRVLKVER